MRIEDWILISNAIVVGVVVVGGFYLRHLVNRQIALKDAAIDVQRATIRRLEGVSAPTLVDQVASLSQFAEDSARRVAELSQMLEKEGADKKQILEKILLQGVSMGAAEGAAAMARAVDLIQARTPNWKDLPEIADIRKSLWDKAAEVLDLSARALVGQRPPLANFAAIVRPELKNFLLDDYWRQIPLESGREGA